jgi:nitrate reductase NapE component
MNRKGRLIFLVILLLLAWPLVCRAEVTRFYFNVWTTQMPDPANPGTKIQRLDVTIQITDIRYRAPDAITSLVVTNPNTTKTMTLTNNCWNELRGQFEASYYLADFPEGKFPSGKYTAKLKDKSTPIANVMTATKTLTPAFLPIPVITAPTEGGGTGLKPTIRWNPVKGAQLYNIHLNNLTQDEPVYMLVTRSLDIYTNSFTLQTGVLKPGTNYSIRIEARDGDKLMNKRSRSTWVNFSTP